MDIAPGFSVALQRHFGVEEYPLTAFNAMRAMVNRLRAAILVAQRDLPAGQRVNALPYIAWKHYGAPSLDRGSDEYQGAPH
jgi:Flp pilus assembly protein CpaB